MTPQPRQRSCSGTYTMWSSRFFSIVPGPKGHRCVSFHLLTCSWRASRMPLSSASHANASPQSCSLKSPATTTGDTREASQRRKSSCTSARRMGPVLRAVPMPVWPRTSSGGRRCTFATVHSPPGTSITPTMGSKWLPLTLSAKWKASQDFTRQRESIAEPPEASKWKAWKGNCVCSSSPKSFCQPVCVSCKSTMSASDFRMASTTASELSSLLPLVANPMLTL
mmetsp:Transcript_13258/g.27547  ORF Transcript_13258/g.27547 Transcript_13258/m.27547 type:complete len:224 (-) Transcript_13258:219-890(-)